MTKPAKTFARVFWLFLGLVILTVLPEKAFAQDQVHYLPPVYSRSTTSNNSLFHIQHHENRHDS